MRFKCEEDFRSWLVNELSITLDSKWKILHGKNVSDILVCNDNEEMPSLVFIEVKYHKANHGRIGFGSGKGKGFQPEILTKKPIYFEKMMRWIIADDKSERCLFFSNDNVRGNSAGQIKEGKQNNFTSNLFEKNKNITFDIAEAPIKIANWLNSIIH